MVVHEHRRREDGGRLAQCRVAVGRGQLVEEGARLRVGDVGLHHGLGAREQEPDHGELGSKAVGRVLPQLGEGHVSRRLEDRHRGDHLFVQLADVVVETRDFALRLGKEPRELGDEGLRVGVEGDGIVAVEEPIHDLVPVHVDGLAESVHQPAMGIEAALAEAEEHGGAGVVGEFPAPVGRSGAARPVALLDHGDFDSPLRQERGRREPRKAGAHHDDACFSVRRAL